MHLISDFFWHHFTFLIQIEIIQKKKIRYSVVKGDKVHSVGSHTKRVESKRRRRSLIVAYLESRSGRRTSLTKSHNTFIFDKFWITNGSDLHNSMRTWKKVKSSVQFNSIRTVQIRKKHSHEGGTFNLKNQLLDFDWRDMKIYLSKMRQQNFEIKRVLFS